MSQGSRPARVGDLLRGELAELLARRVKDPGIGFVTVTRVQISPDLQHARVYYITLGDEAQRRNSARALHRAAPFLRREIAQRLPLKRTPALTFVVDRSIAHQRRVEELLEELGVSNFPPADPETDSGDE